MVGSRNPDGFDADALTYITAVEAADGQALEFNVKTAYNAFVVGCKSDGIWSAIKNSCIMAGAKTLSGALVPLVGVAPSGFNLASGQYSRSTGLKGDGASMYLSSNVKANAFNISGLHMASFISPSAGPAGDALGYQGNNSLALLRYESTNNVFRGYMNDTTFRVYSSGVVATPTFYGFSRNSNTSYTSRVLSSGITHTVTAIANTPSFNIGVGATILNTGLITAPISYAILFYSIGTPLNLTLLDNRVTRLVNEIQFFLNTGLDGGGYDVDTLKYVNAGYAAGGSLS